MPEEKRFCGHPECGAPWVGRATGDPALLEGFCSRDRTPFSFRPQLLPGDLVGGQYAVKGCIAHGGLGWIHLAQDRNVERQVGGAEGPAQHQRSRRGGGRVAERQFLAELDHPNIVRIINFVEHGNDGYLVMDYVPGKSLRAILDDRRQANGGVPDPLPVADAIAFVLEILPAFAYLHGRGVLYCDFKPDNVMHTGATVQPHRPRGRVPRRRAATARVRHAGLPGARDRRSAARRSRATSSPSVAPSPRCARRRPVAAPEYTLPTPDEEPLFARYDPLYRFLLQRHRAEPDERFQSADEMAAQLTGVLREVVAHETGTPRPGTSECFTGELRSAPAGPDGARCRRSWSSADDPAAGFLASLPAGHR